MPAEHFDVLIVGAGLSGIGAAHHLQEAFPERSYAILEARGVIGGTWDLFRYPGIRSDSDMHTLGYRFRPWSEPRTIAPGEAILEYVRETAREDGVEAHIRFHHRVISADWSSEESLWTVEAERADGGGTARFTCNLLWSCSGYYRYDEGYTPDFAGVERFSGTVIHPQHWPRDLDHSGKRVVVIGSGATAVTLVPAMAATAAHVTMLQRSPSYIASLPAEDPLAHRLRRFLPGRMAFGLVRWKNILVQLAVFRLSRRRPAVVKRMIRRGLERALPPGYDIDTHFTPRYDPWDQRLCLIADGDLFAAISSGDVTVVTDGIDAFTERGIRLASGGELEADVIVTATGLNLLFLGGIELAIDGEPVDVTRAVTYRGMMLSGVPNFLFTVGYTNASWTLKADLVSEYACRLLAHMDAGGHSVCVPELSDPTITEEPLIGLTSGFVLRSLHRFPKQGSRPPWKLRQNYLLDLRALRHGRIEDGTLRFSRGRRRAAPPEAVETAGRA